MHECAREQKAHHTAAQSSERQNSAGRAEGRPGLGWKRGEARHIHPQRRVLGAHRPRGTRRAQRRARSTRGPLARGRASHLAASRPPPPRRPPVPTAAARRSPFASLPRPQRAMLTAPRRLLRLCSSTFRMGDSASRLPRKEEALPGRSQRVPVAGRDRPGRLPPRRPPLRKANPGPHGGLSSARLRRRACARGWWRRRGGAQRGGREGEDGGVHLGV